MIRTHTRPQGTRVTVRQGSFPIDPTLVGRSGIVLHQPRGGGVRYGIQLDGETRIRVFTEEELENAG